MRSSRLVVALGRHAGTEVTGASQGTHYQFISLEQALRPDCTLVRVPPYYYSMDARGSLAIAAEILDVADVCVFGLPPHAVDLDAFFLVREHVRKRVPFIYLPLGEFPRGAWSYRHIHSRLTAEDLVLFSSRADKACHDALVAATPARTAVVPFGVDTTVFRRSRRSRSDLRRHLGLGEEAVVFVVHGRIMAEKNVHGALMMFRRIARDHPDARLWIVGAIPDDVGRGPGTRVVSQLPAGRLSATFTRLLAGTNLEDRVLFWGAVSHATLPQILNAADIGVNLTLYEDENFGFSSVEAMGCGLPVIGTDWGGLKDTIADGDTGFLVPTAITAAGIGFDQWRAWRAAAALAEDRRLRTTMGRAGAARAERLFSLERLTRDFLGEIRRTVATATARSERTHVWSALGRRLVRRYSRRSSDARMVAQAIPPVPDRFVRHPLLRTLLVPYSTGVQATKPSRCAVYFLATDLLELRGPRVRSHDPRYVLTASLRQPLDRRIIRLLKARGFCDYESLARETSLRWNGRRLRAALRRLLSGGLILQSQKA